MRLHGIGKEAKTYLLLLLVRNNGRGEGITLRIPASSVGNLFSLAPNSPNRTDVHGAVPRSSYICAQPRTCRHQSSLVQTRPP